MCAYKCVRQDQFVDLQNQTKSHDYFCFQICMCVYVVISRICGYHLGLYLPLSASRVWFVSQPLSLSLPPFFIHMSVYLSVFASLSLYAPAYLSLCFSFSQFLMYRKHCTKNSITPILAFTATITPESKRDRESQSQREPEIKT